MKQFTAFCQESNGMGTIWIESITARSLSSAIKKARKECAAAWEYPQSNVHVLGIAEGDVTILHWEDLNCN
jgi:hypothetical protein